ncbi:acetate--CoA ligase family protein, partial [Acidiphilium sp.]|uniref:acetate--CoA ligase family protein n=1 Tax=Acidiphilium sp. TaxID=527 RepID=UPI003CFC1EF4
MGDEPIDLALIADLADNVPHMLAALSGQVRGAAIIYAKVENLRETAVAARVRVIGSRSFGLAVPGISLNALLTDAPVPPGRVALLAQSHALARAVIDWAEPNGVGFSTIVGIGDNADIGFGRILDHLSRDPGTGPILMEISGLRDPRLFLSAAKAAARLRPIVAIAPGGRLADPRFMAMAGFESALARAGVLLTSTLGTFLAAAETLSRARPARKGGLAIIGNSRGGCRLAADAVLAAGFDLAPLTPATNQALALLLGTDPIAEALVTVLDAQGPRLAALVAVLGAAPEVGGIIVILAPSGADDDATIAALIACAADTKTPLLTAILGQSTGAVRRRRLAEAGVAVFATPEEAVAGYNALRRHSAIQTIARELPSSTVLDIEPDRAAVAKAIAATRTEGRTVLSREAALSVLRAYGIGTVESKVATTPETVAATAAHIGFPVVVKLTAPSLIERRPVGSLALDLPDAPSAEAAARLIETRLRGRGEFPPDACFIVQRQIDHARILR